MNEVVGEKYLRETDIKNVKQVHQRNSSFSGCKLKSTPHYPAQSTQDLWKNPVILRYVKRLLYANDVDLWKLNPDDPVCVCIETRWTVKD